jgi:PIN domain nuclease of toxin-antitoxin system
MRLLLDTHVAIWELSDDARLSAHARKTIRDPENVVFVSTVSLWEIAIKFARRRGRRDDMPISARQALDLFLSAGYEILAITAQHALAVGDLPSLHADPFDRMLVAQARSEPIHLMTSDATLAAYGPEIELI